MCPADKQYSMLLHRHSHMVQEFGSCNCCRAGVQELVFECGLAELASPLLDSFEMYTAIVASS